MACHLESHGGNSYRRQVWSTRKSFLTLFSLSCPVWVGKGSPRAKQQTWILGGVQESLTWIILFLLTYFSHDHFFCFLFSISLHILFLLLVSVFMLNIAHLKVCLIKIHFKVDMVAFKTYNKKALKMSRRHYPFHCWTVSFQIGCWETIVWVENAEVVETGLEYLEAAWKIIPLRI